MAQLRRAATILAAFIAANFVAVHILLAGKVLTDFSNFGYYFQTDFWSPPAIYGLTATFGTLALCLIALMPALVILPLTETFKIRRIWFYIFAAGAGAMTFDILCTRYDLVQARSFCQVLTVSELLIVTIAGAAAGYVFWKLAGNRAGEWGSGARSVASLRD